jgi:DNA-binding NtrC family response regulator
VDAAHSAAEALGWASERHYDAAILDLVMPERDGMDLAGALRERIPGLPIAIFTGYVNSPLLENAERARIAVLKKPIETQAIVDFLEGSGERGQVQGARFQVRGKDEDEP